MPVNNHTRMSMARRLTFLLPGMLHWSGHPAPTNVPRSSSKSPAAVLTSSMPSCSTRLPGLSTPSQATRAIQRCSRKRTAAKPPPSTGTILVHAWFSVGRRSSVKSGCRMLGLTPSTCHCTLCTLRNSELERYTN